MSDWEDFCESKGVSIGNNSDYEYFMDSIVSEPKKRKSDSLHFETFEEAKVWAKKNIGKAFTRSPDGHGFVPKNK